MMFHRIHNVLLLLLASTATVHGYQSVKSRGVRGQSTEGRPKHVPRILKKNDQSYDDDDDVKEEAPARPEPEAEPEPANDEVGKTSAALACQAAQKGKIYPTDQEITLTYRFEIKTDDQSTFAVGRSLQNALQAYMTRELVLKNCQNMRTRRLQQETDIRGFLAQQIAFVYEPCQYSSSENCQVVEAKSAVFIDDDVVMNEADTEALTNSILDKIYNDFARNVVANNADLADSVLFEEEEGQDNETPTDETLQDDNTSGNTDETDVAGTSRGIDGVGSPPINTNTDGKKMTGAGIFFLALFVCAIVALLSYLTYKEFKERQSDDDSQFSNDSSEGLDKNKGPSFVSTVSSKIATWWKEHKPTMERFKRETALDDSFETPSKRTFGAVVSASRTMDTLNDSFHGGAGAEVILADLMEVSEMPSTPTPWNGSVEVVDNFGRTQSIEFPAKMHTEEESYHDVTPKARLYEISDTVNL